VSLGVGIDQNNKDLLKQKLDWWNVRIWNYNGSHWEWRILGVADPRSGGSWEWRTLWVAGPGSGGPSPQPRKETIEITL